MWEVPTSDIVWSGLVKDVTRIIEFVGWVYRFFFPFDLERFPQISSNISEFWIIETNEDLCSLESFHTHTFSANLCTKSGSGGPKIEQTKMLVTCQRFGDLFLFELVWQYSSVQIKYNKGRFKVTVTCSSNITLSLPLYTGSALKRGLNSCTLMLIYDCRPHFWL